MRVYCCIYLISYMHVLIYKLGVIYWRKGELKYEININFVFRKALNVACSCVCQSLLLYKTAACLPACLLLCLIQTAAHEQL